jgi:hypothetical protein
MQLGKFADKKNSTECSLARLFLLQNALVHFAVSH